MSFILHRGFLLWLGRPRILSIKHGLDAILNGLSVAVKIDLYANVLVVVEETWSENLVWLFLLAGWRVKLKNEVLIVLFEEGVVYVIIRELHIFWGEIYGEKCWK